MPETASFTLKYDGPALSDHTIDINDLAPALLALSDLLQETNKIINADRADLSIKVKAREPGCFQVDVVILQSILERARDLFDSHTATAIANLVTILGIPASVVGSVIYLVRFLKGQKPNKVLDVSPTTIQITNNNNQTIIIHKTELSLYLSPIVRKSFYQILKPVEKDGIDVVELSTEGGSAKITKADVSLFNPQIQEEEIQETIRDVYVNVENAWLSGKENRKWKFREGDEGASWNADISDQKFLEGLIRGDVSLSGADTLKVRVKQIQYSTGAGIKSEYEIIQILEHTKGAVNMPLLLPPPSPFNSAQP